MAAMRSPQLWGEAGRAWLAAERRQRPAHWRRAHDGGWDVHRFDRWRPLEPMHAMQHVNAFEAQAWCTWADRRLPTEAEWEKAAVDGLLATPGSVWEWTATPFRPLSRIRGRPLPGLFGALVRRSPRAPWRLVGDAAAPRSSAVSEFLSAAPARRVRGVSHLRARVSFAALQQTLQNTHVDATVADQRGFLHGLGRRSILFATWGPGDRAIALSTAQTRARAVLTAVGQLPNLGRATRSTEA